MNDLANAVDYVSWMILSETIRAHDAFNRTPPAAKPEMDAIERNLSGLRSIRDQLEALAPRMPHE